MTALAGFADVSESHPAGGPTVVVDGFNCAGAGWVRTLHECSLLPVGTLPIPAARSVQGEFQMKLHSRADFAESEPSFGIPTWEIENGTGDYASLSGSGDMTNEPLLDPETDSLVESQVYTGQVQPG